MEQKVIELLSEGITEFRELLAFTGFSKKKLKELLENLIEEGLVYHPKDTWYYGIIKTGKLTIKEAGDGFITVDKEEQDYFVKEEEVKQYYTGDIVSFYPYNNSHRLLNAAIIKIVKRGHEYIVGALKRTTRKGKARTYILSTMKDFQTKALVKKEIPNLKDGQIVYAKLSYVGTALEAEIVECIGHPDDPGIEISQIALEHGFPINFPYSVYSELEAIPTEVHPKDYHGRRDFREDLIFTIDGDDSKDFDDAVSILKQEDGSFILGVYIADVSAYVKEGTALDQEALKRGTSVYLADRVIPMLPHKLSNGICSLNPNEDRLVLACLMTISKEGKLLNYDICEGVIHSKYRMTYAKVNQILEKNLKALQEFPDLTEPLNTMQELASILQRKRRKMGALEFDVKEYKFHLNQQGEPIDVAPIVRAEAEKLIEAFMLMANETIAYHMNILQLPCMYRIHEKPDQEKLLQSFQDLATMGINIPQIRGKISSSILQKLLDEMDELPHKEIYHHLLLRSMMKAKYSPLCLGHFGLAMRYYCHFTSPIRRYPDLMVHRILKETIFHPEHMEEKILHFQDLLPEYAAQNSLSERNAIDCEREVNAMLYAWFMEKELYKVYSGIITSVPSFGIFVTLHNGVEGLVSLENMNGYYSYLSESNSYTDGSTMYRLGDEVEVVVIGADRKTQRIDFMFLKDYNDRGRE